MTARQEPSTSVDWPGGPWTPGPWLNAKVNRAINVWLGPSTNQRQPPKRAYPFKYDNAVVRENEQPQADNLGLDGK